MIESSVYFVFDHIFSKIQQETIFYLALARKPRGPRNFGEIKLASNPTTQ